MGSYLESGYSGLGVTGCGRSYKLANVTKQIIFRNGLRPLKNLIIPFLIIVCLVLLTAGPAGAWLINSTRSAADNNVGDLVCNTGSTVGEEPECTLRAAIEEINANPLSTGLFHDIFFDIPFDEPGGGCDLLTDVCTILPSPNLRINEPVIVHGYSQPGASRNTLEVGNDARLLIELSGSRLDVLGDDSVVEGLIINANSVYGLYIMGASGVTVRGNFIGTDPTGAIQSANAGGIAVGLDPFGMVPGLNTEIGGDDPEDRNIISGNTSSGISIWTGCNETTVKNNYIGVNGDGLSALPNQEGISIRGQNSSISENIISTNSVYGIRIYPGSEGNLITNNNIGTFSDGSPAGNHWHNIFIQSSSDNGITFNTIANSSTGAGILVGQGTGNYIQNNEIFDNDELGIDLGTTGVTPNDDNDVDDGANNLQNFPVLTSVYSTLSTSINVDFTLNSTPETTFHLQFFSSQTCNDVHPPGYDYGEGEFYLGWYDAGTDGSGNASGTAEGFVLPDGHAFITATATDPFNNTSEFSQCIEFLEDTADLEVTKTDSSDPVGAGEDLTYTITVTNNGPSEATSVTITDNMPAGMTFDSSLPAGICSAMGDTVTCDVDNLSSDAATVVYLNVTAPNAAGTYNNTAHVTASQSDPDSTFDTDIESTTVILPDISITDTINTSDDQLLDFGVVLVGETAGGQLTVANTGSVPLHISPVVGDPLDPPFSVLNPEACFGMTFGTGEDCTLWIEFAPESDDTGDEIVDSFTLDFGALSADVTVTGTAVLTVADLEVVSFSRENFDNDPIFLSRYEVIIRNNGPDEAEGCIMDLDLPDRAQSPRILSGDPIGDLLTCTDTVIDTGTGKHRFHCELPSPNVMAVAGSAIITVEVDRTGNLGEANITLSATSVDPDESNNSKSVDMAGQGGVSSGCGCETTSDLFFSGDNGPDALLILLIVYVVLWRLYRFRRDSA